MAKYPRVTAPETVASHSLGSIATVMSAMVKLDSGDVDAGKKEFKLTFVGRQLRA